MLKKFIILLTIAWSFIWKVNYSNAEFIDYFPNIKPLQVYTLNLKNYLQGKKKNSKYYVIREEKIFNSSSEILYAVQKQLIHFAIIQLRVLKQLDVNGNLNPLINKAYNLNDFEDSYSKTISLKLELKKYGIFLISLLSAGKYYLFSTINNIDKIKKSQVSIGISNDIFLKKFKKVFQNTLILDDIYSLEKYIKNGIFNSGVITTIDYIESGAKFSVAYDCRLKNEKFCFISNYQYWKKLPQAEKLLFWSFCQKNNKLFYMDIKKFQDKILNNLIIKKLSFF